MKREQFSQTEISISLKVFFLLFQKDSLQFWYSDSCQMYR